MNLRLIIKTLFISSMIVTICSCTSGGVLKADRLQQNKRVAIVGYELIQMGPADLSLKGILTHQDSGGFGKPAVIKKDAHAVNIYKTSTQSLADDFKWNVVSYESLSAHSQYQTVFKDRMSGFRNLPTVPENFVIHHAQGIMDWGAVERMDDNGRASLAKNLGVDALVLVSLQSEPERSGLLGVLKGAKFKPFSTLRLRIYDANGAEVLWNAGGILGDTVEGDATIAGGENNIGRVNQLVTDSVRIVWKKALETYKKASSQSAT